MADRAPNGLKAPGRRLWKGVTEALELDEHERALLIEACRTADQLDLLDEVVADEGVLVDGRAHPALVEARQQRITLTRLVAALRLPEDLERPELRPQRRGPRGAYGSLRAVGQ